MKSSIVFIIKRLTALSALGAFLFFSGTSFSYEIDFSTYKPTEEAQLEEESYIPKEYESKPYEYDEYLLEQAKERYADILEETTYDLFGEKKSVKHAADELKFRKSDPLFSQPDKDKALYQALALKDSSKLKEALEAGANPNTTIYYQETPLLAAFKAWHNSAFSWVDGLTELVIAGGRIDENNERILKKEIEKAFPAENFDQNAQNRYSFILDLISASKRDDAEDRLSKLEQALENLSYSLAPEQRALVDSKGKKTPDESYSDEPDDLYRWEYLEIDEPQDSLWSSIKKKIGLKKEKKVIIDAPLSEEEEAEWEIIPPVETTQEELDEWEIIEPDKIPNASIL